MSDIRFCTRCGATLQQGQAFCTSCGASLAELSAAEAAAETAFVQPAPSAPRVLKRARSAAANAGSIAGQSRSAYAVAAGAAGLAAALPWQTLHGAEQPDIQAFVTSAALPLAQQAVRRSLRGTGVALLATSALDLGVAVVTGGPAALTPALQRFAMAAVTSLSSIVTGRRSGALRVITGLLGLATMCVQLGATGWALYGGLQSGTPVMTLLPSIVAMLSTLVMALKTSIVAFRRR